MSRPDDLHVLILLGAAQRAAAGPLLRQLEAAGCFRLTVADAEDGIGELDHRQVLLAAAEVPLEDAGATRLRRFLEAGGGVVALHSTLAAWARTAAGAAVAGWSPGEALPETELALRPLPGNQVTDRLDPEPRISDRLLLASELPDRGRALLMAHWHYSERPLAFTLPIGAGRLVQLGLGGTPATYGAPLFHQLVHRCLREAAGREPRGPIGVGLYGYGAIGREHAGSISAVPGFQLSGVCDRSAARREEAAAAFGAPTHEDAASILADPAVELVVVGVPPAAHADAVLQCLRAGKHVVCEKPFTLRAAEADHLIAEATAAGLALTVYQSRRWDPDFVAMKTAVSRGSIGEPFYMESFIGGHSHPCNYWHSHAPVSGGTIYDWGSHYFDWVLSLFPERLLSVSAVAQKRVWHDVTNSDQVRVDLLFEGGKQAGFLQSDIAAAAKPKWYLLGTEGAIVGDWRQESVKSRAWTGDLVEERLAPAESPAEVSIHRPDGNGQSHRESLALAPRIQYGFYRNLGDHLLLGEAPAVRPQEARRNVAVMEAAAHSIAGQGRPVEVDA